MFNNTQKRYNQYSAHLKNKFGVKVYKITLDAGFSCPNRDGTKSFDGCTFCDEGGSFSQAHSNLLSVEEQLETGIETLSERFKAKKFMSYFQAYSNTYKSVEELEKIYNSALQHPDIVGISIGTRPDCVDNAKLRLISSFKEDYYTWIEYGLQSIHDKTLLQINRGHDFNCFLKTYEKSKQAGLNVCVHVILGLPGETKTDMLKTAQKLAELKIDGIKIHMLCALKGTKLTTMYEEGKISFISEDDYIQTVCDFLEILPPETIIHRLAGNGLKKNLIEPRWLGKKLDCLNKIDRELGKRNSYQGKLHKKNSPVGSQIF
ncbi:MAG: TIGR01212 family radical SAM protein [Candidatus Gastranaerophilales bacterium]|nr:TIGR01212 family radical SAM protein [Candidatus Gastranaerophilales bacterium]